jgi:hypothetical protein
MSSPSDLSALRAAYKVKNQQFKVMDDKWNGDRAWARRLELEKGDYLGQVSKARRTPAGYNELKAEVAQLGEELRAAELSAKVTLPPLVLTELKKERKATRDLKIRLAMNWMEAGGDLPIPPELLAADAHIQQLTAELESKATQDYKAEMMTCLKTFTELRTFHLYDSGMRDVYAHYEPYWTKLERELDLWDDIQYERTMPNDYKDRGFWNVNDCLRFGRLCKKGLPASPFLYNQDDPRNYELPVEERLRVIGTPSVLKPSVDIVSMLKAASAVAHQDEKLTSAPQRLVTTPMQCWQLAMIQEKDAYDRAVQMAWG